MIKKKKNLSSPELCNVKCNNYLYMYFQGSKQGTRKNQAHVHLLLILLI